MRYELNNRKTGERKVIRTAKSVREFFGVDCLLPAQIGESTDCGMWEITRISLNRSISIL